MITVSPVELRNLNPWSLVGKWHCLGRWCGLAALCVSLGAGTHYTSVSLSKTSFIKTRPFQGRSVRIRIIRQKEQTYGEIRD